MTFWGTTSFYRKKNLKYKLHYKFYNTVPFLRKFNFSRLFENDKRYTIKSGYGNPEFENIFIEIILFIEGFKISYNLENIMKFIFSIQTCL